MSRRPRISDHYSRLARRQNYPARSVYKLEEIDRKHRLLRPGQAVLDLGCAPGSWLLYSCGRVGPDGLVVGVDVHGLDVALPPNARYLRRDALSVTLEELREICSRPFDVVLSDMAPHTSGTRFLDQQRSLALLLRALEIATATLRVGGSFVGKVFQGEDVGEARERAKGAFRSVRMARPRAVRQGSYEVYLVCEGARAAGPAGGDT